MRVAWRGPRGRGIQIGRAMDTGIEQARVILGGIGGIFAIDGFPRYLGLYGLGFIHLYRNRAVDRWTRLLPIATVYIAAAVVALAAGPHYLLPPWAARMAARSWAGYWGDEADSADQGTKLWATAMLWSLAGGAVVAWILVSPGLEKLWPLGLGAAATLASASSSSKRPNR